MLAYLSALNEASVGALSGFKIFPNVAHGMIVSPADLKDRIRTVLQ